MPDTVGCTAVCVLVRKQDGAGPGLPCFVFIFTVNFSLHWKATAFLRVLSNNKRSTIFSVFVETWGNV